jgi:hypothetical protein
MALKQNGRLLQQSPLRFRGGSVLSMEAAEINKSSFRNIYAGEAGIDPRSAIPNGNLDGGSWVFPQKSGGMSAYKSVSGLGLLIGSLALGLPGASTIAGTSTVTATGSVLANMAGAITGSGTVTADATIVLNGAINITASSTETFNPSALGNIEAAVGNNTGTVYGIPFASGVITCDISPFTELSPQNLATAVWSAEVSQNIESGSMGRLLYDAGGGASPEIIAAAVWSELVASNQDADSFGEAVQYLKDELDKRLKTSTFIALK